MAVVWKERVGNYSPFKLGLDQSGGRVVCTYLVTLTEDSTIEDLIEEALGGASAAGDGRIDRALPKACPQLPFFFCEKIQQLVGIGGDGELVDVDLSEWLEAETLVSQYWEYTHFEVTLEYTRRPYKVSPNSLMANPVQTTYYLEDGTEGAYIKTTEADRFAWWEPQAQPEVLTFQQGQAVFVLDSSSIQAPAGTSITGAEPHSYGFNALPQIYLPKTTVRFFWVGVPYTYITHENSYIRSFIGYLNQHEFQQWRPGELLYLGPASVRRYPPPVPEWETEFGFAPSTSMLCDIELVFLETSRIAGGTVPTAHNRSWITAGHNLLPWSRDRKFYYAVTPDQANPNDTTKWVPPYPRSVPFDILFTDPSV